MFAWFSRRYLDLLGSIYIYNEHRGYTALDRVLEAVRARSPDDRPFIAAIEKHRADERKHYLMFRRWYEKRGQMPLLVDRTCGHIDRFVEIMFRSTIDRLDTDRVIAEDRLFEKLCRVISLTEKRGYRQVEILLDHPIVRQDLGLIKIFRNLDLTAQLAVYLYGNRNRVIHHQIFIPLRPAGVLDESFVAKLTPEFICHMGGKGCNQLDQTGKCPAPHFF